MIRLHQASTAVRNAAFDAVHADLLRLIDLYAPGFFKKQLVDNLNTQLGVQETLKIIDDALAAAEHAEAQEKAGAKL